MTLVVVGPEGSGTHLLTDLLRACGAEAEQRSLPYASVWWLDEDGAVRFDPATGEPFPDGTGFVLITRDPFCTTRSVLRRHLAPDEATADYARRQAVARLSRLPATPVRYEAIVEAPREVIGSLCRQLGLTLPPDLPPVRDENAKWTDG